MRCPSDVPRLSVLLAAEHQIVSKFRPIKEFAVHPCYGSARALAKILFGALTGGHHPVLQFPGLRLLFFAALFVFLVFVVDAAC